jgi:sister-chromatid-cohesion protein PDS5
MARGRRSAVTEVVEEEEEQDAGNKLTFNQPLVGRPGKQISVGDLLTRLKALCEELRGLEQDEADRESLEPVAKELAHQSLIQHKDAGVRAWTACCIVDMFRLCAPDAPYTAQQLKDIFTLIVVKIMPLIADPSNPYNGQHLYVLRSLAEFKSIVLLTDIPSSSSLTSSLFTTCFDVLSGPSKAESGEELSKNVEHHMTAVLSILIDEAPSLSSDVVDVIVAQFLWADPITLASVTSKGKKNAPVDTKQSTLRRKEAPPAYNMAKNLCNACPDKIARLIGTYFSSVIVDFTSSGNLPSKRRHKADSDDESDDEGTKGPSEDEINDAVKAHRLLRELWRCSPGVLQDIIPHLQEELGTENIQLRQLATETFGDMISGIGAAGPPPRPDLNPAAYPSQSLGPSDSVRTYNFLTTPTSPNSFPTQHPGAYQSFLQRKHDKSPIIRAAWATSIGRILMTSAGGVGLDLDEEQRLLRSFAECLIDSDERVRLATVRAIDHFEFNDIVQKLGSNGSMSEPGSVLSNLADRVKDKKNVLHAESMKLLGKIWGVAEGAIAEGNERITRLLGPIPSRILEACYVNDLEINVQIDLILFEALLPLSYPPMKPKTTANGNSQIVKDSQPTSDQGYTEADLDKIRVERQLVLVKGLEEKAKKVFFAKQGNQVAGATYMEQFLKMCEEYNGGVMNSGEKETKKKLEGLISYYGKTLPDSTRVVEDLWKFAKAHDRRSYHLIRFCMATDSDYRKVFKSIVRGLVLRGCSKANMSSRRNFGRGSRIAKTVPPCSKP